MWEEGGQFVTSGQIVSAIVFNAKRVLMKQDRHRHCKLDGIILEIVRNACRTIMKQNRYRDCKHDEKSKDA